MRIFTPTLRLGERSPPATGFEDQFGGAPWGVAEARWPCCKTCGGTMTFLFQLLHDAERLDLGAEGRVLYLFQCEREPDACVTWEGGSGANACFVLEASERTDERSWPLDGTPEEIEVRVTGWASVDEDGDEPHEGTKLGGTPFWIQGGGEGPEPPFRFVLQMDWQHEIGVRSVPAAHFGDAGIAYIYVNGKGPRPEGWMFWQCI